MARITRVQRRNTSTGSVEFSELLDPIGVATATIPATSPHRRADTDAEPGEVHDAEPGEVHDAEAGEVHDAELPQVSRFADARTDDDRLPRRTSANRRRRR